MNTLFVLYNIRFVENLRYFLFEEIISNNFIEKMAHLDTIDIY